MTRCLVIPVAGARGADRAAAGIVRAAGLGVSTMRTRRTAPRRGTVLVVAMLILFALAAMVVVLSRSLRVDAMAAANFASSLQADAIERGAERYLLALLRDEAEDPESLDESYFAAVPVGDGYFWVLRPQYDDTTLPAFGLTGEADKVNINTASYERLMMLPGMTEELAAAIVDWRDRDSTVSPNGAESEYYLALSEPYYCKNGPFECIEELMLVRGATRELLYGTGQAPPLGTQRSAFEVRDTLFTDPQLERGIADLLTVHSSEPNNTPNGTRRISITNRNQLGDLRTFLRQELGTARGDEITDWIGRVSLRDVFDLRFRSDLSEEEFARIVDSLTSTDSRVVRGRINVNTAPRAVLLTLPELDETDVDRLITERRSTSRDRTSLAWVAEALGEKSVGLGNLLTTRSYQYSADILAVSGDGRAFKRCRIIIDISGDEPVIVQRRDLTDHGWPMDPQILEALRAGEGPGEWADAWRMTSFGGSVP